MVRARPIVSSALAIAAVILWQLSSWTALGEVAINVGFYAAGPAAVASIVVGGIALARRDPPRWVAIVGVILGVAALVYIAVGVARGFLLYSGLG